MGHPAQYTFCVGENEEESPWEPLHVEKGFRSDQSTVTLFGGHSPLQINDHASRDAEQLALSLGWTMAGLWNHKNYPLFSDTVLVVCPEHAKTFAQDGWSKDDLRQFLYEKIRRPLRELRPGVNGGEGAGVSMLRTPKKDREPPTDDTLFPKFPKAENIVIIVAGGTAGRFLPPCKAGQALTLAAVLQPKRLNPKRRSTMGDFLLDPTDKVEREHKTFAPRLETLAGRR